MERFTFHRRWIDEESFCADPIIAISAIFQVLLPTSVTIAINNFAADRVNDE